MLKLVHSALTVTALLGLAIAGAHAQAQYTTITMGTTASVGSPVTHASSDNAYEVIYRQVQITRAGNITGMAFEKLAGTNTSPLDHVKIYMKHIAATYFTVAGPVDSTGYTRVFKGAFTNSTTSGYQEVHFNTAFNYNNTSNLAILVIRQGGANVVASGAAQVSWSVGTTSGNGASRRFTMGTPLTPTSQLTLSQNVANLRLAFNGTLASRTEQTLVTAGYPNPATTHYTVQLTQPNQPATARISDVLGHTVRAEAPLVVRNGAAQVAVADLPAGLYLLHIVQNQQQVVQRFIKE